MALSIDLRERIIAAFEQGGLNRVQIAERFSVSYGAVCNLISLWRETGGVAPRYDRCSGRPPKIGPAEQERLRALLASRCDMTLVELRDAAGLDCTPEAVCLALGRMGLTYKKRRSGPASSSARTSPPGARPGGCG